PPMFEVHLHKALERAELVLAKNKVPVLAKDAPHGYDDKFLVVEHAMNNGIEAIMTAFSALGLSEDGWEKARAWVDDGKAASLRLEASRKCKFLRSDVRKEDSETEHVTKFMGMTSTSKTVKSTTEHSWEIQHAFRIVLFTGSNPDGENSFVLAERSGKTEVKTTGSEKMAPEPETHAFPEQNVNITPLLAVLNKNNAPCFTIDRTKDTCFTPRRNQDVDTILAGLERLVIWCKSIIRHFESIFDYVDDLNRSSFNGAEDLFVPVLPALQEKQDDAYGAIDEESAQALQKEHQVDIDKWLDKIRALLPQPEGGAAAGLVTTLEASVCKLMRHIVFINTAMAKSCDYAERMLHDQLVEAIGKEVTADDMAEYMRYHYQRLFSETIFQPFSFDVKRPGFAPEGSLSIERPGRSEAAEIATCVQARLPNDAERPAIPMRFKLGSATSVEMQGPQYCHGYMAHNFSGGGGGGSRQTLNLVARTRQFSSFVLMVGKISAKDEFAPEHAIVLRNKDCAIMPLLLEPLPSAKAFRDAIESLSPEQQAFAKAMRSMQLASTLFGVAVVEIKPQLEVLLKLDGGSLTKEIALTQDLMRLFIEFQVPCDLVTFDGPETTDPTVKVQVVKGHVKSLMDMMESERKAKVAEEKDRAKDLAYQHMIECNDAEFMSSSDFAEHEEEGVRSAAGELDYTSIPAQMDATFETLDPEGALRSTKISTTGSIRLQTYDSPWMSRNKTETTVRGGGLREHRNKAMDLLDALSRSGELPLVQTQLHIVIATTHCFDQSIMRTIIEKNMNPIERVERSSLLVASTITGKSVPDLLAPAHHQRIKDAAPQIFDISSRQESSD
ncbi:Hypothetical Protein FCC1311_058882, partial [Hondaea fermentalgiana]